MPMAAQIPPPPLREGDRLTSGEFMRRWEAMPDLKHAELIDGIVCMPAPVSRPHSRFHVAISGWLGTYEAHTPGCEAGLGGTWLMRESDVPQPDNTLRISPERGGQSHDEGNYTAGAPEFLAEVAVSSRSRDLGVKLKLYEAMGVQEYLIAVAATKQVLWNELASGAYRLLEPDAEGVIRSRRFPGLWLDVAAFWRMDLPRIFEVLHQGIATSEHDAFAQRLAG